MTLPEKVLAINRALDGAKVPYAFGGAIALAYSTLDPRGTSDIDVNVFTPAADPGPALDALPDGIEQPGGTAGTVARDGQVRLWWDETPVDLFFAYEPVHAEAARNRRIVAFSDARIPILGPDELALFKVMFDRTRDWADIEALVAAGTVDLDRVRKMLAELIGVGDERFARLEAAVQRAGA